MLFTEALDDRGHAAAVAPDGRTAIVFARRPGRFALVLDLARRRSTLAIAPPEHRHFYGHGFFSGDGRLAYATENDFDAGGIGPEPATARSDSAASTKGRQATRSRSSARTGGADAPRPVYAGMNQYIGSVAASRDGALVATTSPRGGHVVLWDAAARTVLETRAIADACGAAPAGSGFLISDGLGRLWRDGKVLNHDQGLAWDNHLATVRAP